MALISSKGLRFCSLQVPKSDPRTDLVSDPFFDLVPKDIFLLMTVFLTARSAILLSELIPSYLMKVDSSDRNLIPRAASFA